MVQSARLQTSIDTCITVYGSLRCKPYGTSLHHHARNDQPPCPAVVTAMDDSATRVWYRVYTNLPPLLCHQSLCGTGPDLVVVVTHHQVHDSESALAFTSKFSPNKGPLQLGSAES